jgi:hypothetical protein
MWTEGRKWKVDGQMILDAGYKVEMEQSSVEIRRVLAG